MNNTTHCEEMPFTPKISLPPAFSLLLSSLGVLTCAFLIKILHQHSGGLPIQVKHLIINICLVYIIRNSFLVYKAIYSLISFVVGLEATSVPYGTCFFEQSFYIVTSICRYLSFFYISLNRLYATIHKPTILNQTSNGISTFSYMLIIIAATWLPCTLYYCVLAAVAIPYLKTTKPALCFCYISNLWTLSLNNYHNILVILIQIFTACIYGVVYKQNKKILNKFIVTTVKNNLNERFAQWTNVKISKWLMPLTLISAVLNISTVLLTSTMRTFMNLDFVEATILALSMMAAFSLEALVFPLLCIRFSPMLMHGVQQQYPRIYKWLKLICLPIKSHNSVNFFNSEVFASTSPDNIPTISDSFMQSRKSKQFEKEMMKNVGRLTDGEKKIVDHRLDPETQTAIMNEMWNKNTDLK